MIAFMKDSPFERIAGAGAHDGAQARLILVCDHASNALPPAYGALGLGAAALETHIAYDIGADAVTRALAEGFGAAAVLARWSRLLIDLNRGADDPTLVMKLSDGRIIPGNRGADADEIALRLARFHAPYHGAIAREIADVRRAGAFPAIVSIHSFTPVWKGAPRPWEVAVLWDRDPRLAVPLLRALKAAGFVTGENEPYTGALENDCMYQHGTMTGLPHALIEIRQDLVASPQAARAFAARLKPVLDAALTQMGKPGLAFTRPLATRGGITMNEQTRTEVEAAVFRRLVAHLQGRTDVQNIDMMGLAGFCRNCLGDWYREAAAEKGVTLEKDDAREIVYGMAPGEWKKRYQTEATPEQKALFQQSQKASSSEAVGHTKKTHS
jgi:predicted N-formylglutamate amidohydrolase